MKVLHTWLERLTAFCLAVLLTPVGAAALTPRSPQPTGDSVAVGTDAQSDAHVAGKTDADAEPPEGYPESPEITRAQAESRQTDTSPPPAPEGQQNATPPVGTAAAPYVKPNGVAASRPAGAAIAPAKQRRSRSFAIRVGLLVGAGIAIGVVTAATLGSPSRPN